MSNINLDIVGGLGMFPNYACVRILVDGTPFVEMVRSYETKMLAGNKEAGLAGSYWYLHPNALIEYLEGDGFGHAHRIALLGCTCLDEDCWPLVCSMEKQEQYVIWYDFLQPHRKQWDYSGFGPFGFEKKQLAAAMDVLKQEYEQLPATKWGRRLP
ncbi:MAG: hypothetical protein NT061_04575 [Spirochaetes bacterium]|nr:hypothetical protein [Spirochaetota bacterium]